MLSPLALLNRWPLIRQLRERTDGTGLESMSDKTRAMHARIDDAKVARSICPYCGGRLRAAHLSQGRKVDLDRGRSRVSPISQGNLCPKGAASYQLLTQSRRVTKMKYRAPFAKAWTEMSTRARDGHGGGPRLGFAAADLRAREERIGRQSHHGDRVTSAARRWTTKRITSSRSCSPAAWAWCACPTRPGYDIPARCPVWAPPSAGAGRRRRNRICATLTAS